MSWIFMFYRLTRKANAMRSATRTVDEGLDRKTIPYIPPDDLVNSGETYVTFIYTADGQLFAGRAGGSLGLTPDASHQRMVTLRPGLLDRYKKLGLNSRGERIGVDLFGRAGYVKSDVSRETYQLRRAVVVSFWNDDQGLYDKLLGPCLDALHDGGFVPDAFFVSTPNVDTVPVGDLKLSGPKELSPDERRRLELHQNLHAMRGAEKADAMRELGVGVGGRPHPMQTAMDKHGLRVPGQKWWAMNSESFTSRIGSVLNDTDRGRSKAIIDNIGHIGEPKVKKSLSIESKLEGRLAMLEATGTSNKHVAKACLSESFGSKLAGLVERGNKDAIQLSTLVARRREIKRRGVVQPALLESVERSVQVLSKRLGLSISESSASIELLDMMNRAVSPAAFSSQRHFKKNLTEGLLLNVSVMASQNLLIPPGQYVVTATTPNHTMLIPTSEIRVEDAGVMDGDDGQFEILTADLVGCWNKLERVIGEDKGGESDTGDYNNPASGSERIGRPALKKKVQAAGGVRSAASKTGLSPGDVSKHVNNKEFEVSGDSARKYMDALGADANDLYKYGSISVWDYAGAEDQDEKDRKEEDTPENASRQRNFKRGQR